MSDLPTPASPDAWKNPFCLSLLVCDAIHRDPGTGKVYILGTFSVFGTRQYPAAMAMSIYIALTDGRGRIPFKLQLVDVDEERQPLFSVDFEVEFNDPLAVNEMTAAFANVTIETPGEYRLQLIANGEHIMERRIIATPPLNQEPPHVEPTES